VTHELRLDPLTREWVAIVADRQGRPNLAPSPAAAADGCPFCVGGTEAPEPYTVRAFENRWPPFVAGDPIDVDSALAAASGFTALPPRGASEVVLYSPAHDGSLATIGVQQVRAVVDLWAARTAALMARPEIEYVLVFENRGALVGATIPHPHGQIYAFPFVPPVPRREVLVAEANGCPLCAAVADERGDGSRVVRDDGGWLTYVPYASAYPYGTVLAPTEHVAELTSLDDAGRDGLAAALADVVARYDRLFDAEMPYLMWIHPGVHLHVHFAPPLRAPGVPRYVASGELGSGTMGNPVAPEAAAARLRSSL
jgi:UDPglucose--hexose-1-phosphate uridylyltransferase